MLAVFYILLPLVRVIGRRFFENRALPYAIEIDERLDKNIGIEGAVIPA
jgi:hypothetical protein